MERVEPLFGDYRIVQDTGRYRFTSDSILLSRFEKGRRGDRVADLLAGCGVVGLHFYALNPQTEHVSLFEQDEGLIALAEKSIALNGLEEKFTPYHVRIQEVSKDFFGKFDLILCNPPYRRAEECSKEERESACRRETDITLTELAAAFSRLLAPKGRAAVVCRAGRVAELLTALKTNGLEPKRLQFVAGRPGKKPYAVLVLAVKGGRTGVDVLPTYFNEE